MNIEVRWKPATQWPEGYKKSVVAIVYVSSLTIGKTIVEAYYDESKGQWYIWSESKYVPVKDQHILCWADIELEDKFREIEEALDD